MAARSKKGYLINSEWRKQRTAQCSSIHLRTQFNAPSLRKSTNRDNVAMSGEAGAAKNASPSREATFGSFSNREGLVRSITGFTAGTLMSECRNSGAKSAPFGHVTVCRSGCT